MSITLDNKRVHDYIVDKDKLVDEGRAIQGKLNYVEEKIVKLESKEKVITAKVQIPKELTDKGDKLMKLMNDTNKELESLIKQVNDMKLAGVPEDMKKEHYDLMAQRETLERERNKIALKVQKIKDKMIPIVQKAVKPLLDEYDDIDTAKAKNGKVVISTFNHLADWKKAFKNK